MSARARVVAAVVGAMVVAACSCSSSTPEAGSDLRPTLPTYSMDKPASQGDVCDDPTGDISNDDTTTNAGSLKEPAGIDLTHMEVAVDGDDLVVRATVVGALAGATNPIVTVFQGDPQVNTSLSWELRFSNKDGPWRSKLIKFPSGAGQRQTESEPRGAVVVRENQLEARISRNDLPVIATRQWLFGTTSGVSDDTRVFDDCIPGEKTSATTPGIATPDGSTPGSAPIAPTTTAIPPGKVGTPISGPDGAQLTVLTIDDPAKPNRKVEAEAIPNTRLASVELQLCARTKALEGINERRFTLRTSDGLGTAPWAADESTNDPRFSDLARLKVNECETGWITFQVADGVQIEGLIYDSSGIGTGPFLTVNR